MRLMLLDGLLAVLAAVLAVRNLGGDLGLLPLAVLAMAPLAVRRRWPVAVFAWLVACSAGVGLWSPSAVPGVALLVALYSVAASRPRPVALGAAAVLEVGVLVTAVRLPGDWVQPAVFLTGMLVAALGLGLYVAAHRAYVTGLHERTLALERDRYQQAELAVAAERARIARDMHDVVAHHLTVMVALSDGAAVAGPDRAAEAMRMVSETGRRALVETRSVVGVLRSPDHPPAHGAAPAIGAPGRGSAGELTAADGSRRRGSRSWTGWSAPCGRPGCRPRWRSAARRRSCRPACSSPRTGSFRRR
jgi:signal transduction histidine kinase